MKHLLKLLPLLLLTIAACTTPTATVIYDESVIYHEDFNDSKARGWTTYYIGSSQTPETWQYNPPRVRNGVAQFGFGFGNYENLKIDTNQLDPDGSEIINLIAFTYIDGSEGSPNLAGCVGVAAPGNNEAHCETPLDLRGKTITFRLRAYEPDGTPGLTNCGQNADNGCILGIWAQGYDASIDRAVNIFTPLNVTFTGEWQTVSITPAVSDWICIGARPDGEDYYGCSTTMDFAVSNITRNWGLVALNMVSNWNPLDPTSYNPALDRHLAGVVQLDWVEISK